MPGKPRGGKRKQWKRLPRRGRKTVVVNSALQPIAQRYICKLKYSETFVMNASVSAFRFRLNSLYDPNLTTTGHQPYGFDQLAGLYNRYRVIDCSYNIVATNDVPIRIMALPANDSVSPTDPSNSMENPRCKWAIQLPGGNTKVLKGKVHIPSLVGRTKQQYMADDRYQATVGASPDEAAILNIFHGNMTDLSYPTANTQVVITLQYHVEFFDVKTQSQS